MTKIKTVTHYAHSAHGQVNNNLPEAKLRNIWNDINKASAADVTKAPQGSAHSSYGKKKGKDTKPWTFTGIDFRFEIPECAYIKEIEIHVPMNKDGNSTIKSPYVKFNLYGGTKSVASNVKEHNGWYNGYLYQTSSHKYLSKAWKTHVYKMTGEQFYKRGYSVSALNQSIFGIDLYFQDATEIVETEGYNLHIKYVSCKITYEMPDEAVTFDKVTTGDNPRLVNCGDNYTLKATYQNKSNAGCCGNTTYKGLKVKIPPNARIISYSTPQQNNFNPDTNTWTVNCKPNAKYTLDLTLKDYGAGLDKISILNSDYWVYSVLKPTDVGEVIGYVDVMQKDVNSCITFESTVNASDGEATYHIDICHDKEGTLEDYNVSWTLDTEKSSNGVSIQSSTNHEVVFNVPRGEPVNIVFKGCFLPELIGEKYATVRLDNNPIRTIPYNVIEPPIYIVRNNPKLDPLDRTIDEITLTPSLLKFRTHRVATSTEIEAYIIDCGVAEFDGTMIEDNCTLSANVWEKLDYIGCVPLYYHHYDPQSTYSNKGISESYKNKTYKGKEGVIDEDITLKFKARPKQVPVLQGLVKLDKPTPINANWRCFEGDPLNHRGWAVLSEIKTERTNPLWYDCEAKVDYITHDIYTKFQIFKELPVNTKPMPQIMAETFELGENLSTATDIFKVDTDGGFIYDEDGEDGAKNIFSLDENQFLSIATVKPLADVFQLRFDWYSTLIDEYRENTIERIFSIKDAEGNVILEYEYTNFVFGEDYVTCDIIVRVKNEGESWNVETYTDVDLRTSIEADPIAEDDDNNVTYYYFNETTQRYEVLTDSTYEGTIYIYEDGEYVIVDSLPNTDDDDDAYDPSYISPNFEEGYEVTTVYGTSTEFTVNGTKISIFESGYNGREIAIENIELLKSKSYSFECYWFNNNEDGNTEDIISYIDIGLSETLLSTDYAKLYNNLMVSPFPIPHKTVVYTRESEEGTIFYLTGEEPFKYRIEPYYQYHCGCDLVTREGVSIFDLNNSYTSFYIENGLVRLGFNKFNGRLSLAKWDIISKEWLTTHYFHMSENTKFSLASYSDDKIVIKAGNTTYFTIWRGHPFIGIKNPNDEIFIDSNFSYCLSDRVDGQDYDYPIVFSFMNTNNLLPDCIGGTKLDYDCLYVTDDDITSGTSHELTITPPSDVVAGEETILDVTLTNPTNDGSVHYIINNIDVATVPYPFDLTYTFQEPKAYVVQAVYVGDDDDEVAISEKIVVTPATPNGRDDAPIHDDDQDRIVGNYHLKIISAPKKFTFKDGKQVVLQLTKGTTPIKRFTVELQMPNGQTYSTMTDNQGKVSITNTAYSVGKYQWGGRFYDATDTDMNRKLIVKALRWIDIEKATPTLSSNAKDGLINKGKNLNIKLMGVNAPRQNQKLTYSINGGSKKSKRTNDNGKIHIPMNEKGTFKVKVMYAGTENYEAVTKTFTVKVV